MLRLAVCAAALAGGCATSTPPPPTATAGPGDAPRRATRLTRCSDVDPDRDAWFCVIGRILYATLSMMQHDVDSRLR